jgi:hypothetical protein
MGIDEPNVLEARDLFQRDGHVGWLVALEDGIAVADRAPVLIDPLFRWGPDWRHRDAVPGCCDVKERDRVYPE